MKIAIASHPFRLYRRRAADFRRMVLCKPAGFRKASCCSGWGSHCRYALENPGGVMVWELTQDTADEDKGLLQAIGRSIKDMDGFLDKD